MHRAMLLQVVLALLRGARHLRGVHVRANLVVAVADASSALGGHQPRWGSLWPVVLFRVRAGCVAPNGATTSTPWYYCAPPPPTPPSPPNTAPSPCECSTSPWTFMGTTYTGCVWPDNDPDGPWCRSANGPGCLSNGQITSDIYHHCNVSPPPIPPLLPSPPSPPPPPSLPPPSPSAPAVPCACATSWTWQGSVINGCANPRGASHGPWCQSSCGAGCLATKQIAENGG